MNAEPTTILDVAAAVSDGSEVDWQRAEIDAADEAERDVIRQLHAIADVAEAHRDTSAPVGLTGDPIERSATLDPSELPTMSAGDLPITDPPQVPITWAHLEVREKVGEGAFAAVYRAWDPRLEREVALKLMHPREGSLAQGRDDEAARVLREGRNLARVRCPQVVTVYGAEVHDGAIGLWMEFIRGRSLHDVLRKQGPFGAREATLIGVDLCRAVAAVHGAGLVHRDIKAHNVMREEGGRIVLMDFGAGADYRDDAPSGTHVLSGTPLYMAPELFRGQAPTPSTDIYSLGVLLYHLVTGAYPVEGRNFLELAEAHRSGRPKLLRDVRSDLPETFVQAVERALAGDPAERFASAGEMEQALLTALGAGRREGTEQPVRETGQAFASRRRLAIAAAATVVLVAAGLWFGRARLLGAGGYTVEAAMYRSRQGVRERIEPGGQIAIGDALSIELQGSTALHVYVLDQDDRGDTYLLFPLPGVEPSNPLPAGTTHRLPGSGSSGRPLSWKVTTTGGHEHFLVLASPTPLDALTAELQALPKPQSKGGDQYALLSRGAIRKLRGVGGIEEEPAPETAAASSRLFERVARLAARPEETKGVWVRQIDLENPEAR